jgi:hypothetical protein
LKNGPVAVKAIKFRFEFLDAVGDVMGSTEFAVDRFGQYGAGKFKPNTKTIVQGPITYPPTWLKVSPTTTLGKLRAWPVKVVFTDDTTWSAASPACVYTQK